VQWRDDGTWAKLVKVVRERARGAAGRTPSVVCIDSHAVKTTEMGGPERGDDGGKKINGRKRHLLVDTLGVWLVVLMTKASLDDGAAAALLLSQVHPYHFPRLVTIFQIKSITITLWRLGWLSTVQAGASKCGHVQPAHKVLRPWRNSG